MANPRLSNMSFEVSGLRATAHPVRLQILSLLTGAELSASEVARELGITQANASYHLRVLDAAGLVEIAGTHTVRGGVAKTYRHPWRRGTSGSDQQAPDDDRTTATEEQAFVTAVAEELRRRSMLRAPRTKGNFTDAELWVSPEHWAEAMSLVNQAADLLHANARPPRTADTTRVNMTAALFQMRPDV